MPYPDRIPTCQENIVIRTFGTVAAILALTACASQPQQAAGAAGSLPVTWHAAANEAHYAPAVAYFAPYRAGAVYASGSYRHAWVRKDPITMGGAESEAYRESLRPVRTSPAPSGEAKVFVPTKTHPSSDHQN